mgnify:CR=1 FL=1
MARDNEPVVIALDEIHMLNNELQSSLLTLLNNRVYVSPLDVSLKYSTAISSVMCVDKRLPSSLYKALSSPSTMEFTQNRIRLGNRTWQKFDRKGD